MRLSKLKLAGFKTFVDPTTVHTPGNLVGIVGPNGCGKSNIIDAVRWVLGETRASALRGESMQDVIFNGSGTRKPVSRASVELVFDNGDGRASGQWSQYAEIAVKRVLDRSGESSYYINNVHVRRKDVVDVFLGTGLGPRAYAIIEQGMISRIIEARPEEIRGFLEEAAGVTKYRERRRETEGRLRDARDNLTRLDDIRTELGERVAHLAVQAEVAARYRNLRDRHAQRQDLLWLMKRDSAREEQRRLHADLADAGRRMEADSERLQELERIVEAGREKHLAASEALNLAQSDFYAASAEVGRLESELERIADMRRRIGTRLGELDAEAVEWQSRQQHLLGEGERWRELLDNACMRREQAVARHDELAECLPAIEDAVRTADATAQAVRRELNQAEQQLRVQEAHRSSAQRALAALAERRGRLSGQPTGPQPPQAIEIARAEDELQALEAGARQRENLLGELQARLPEAQARMRACADAERAAQRALTEVRARRDALIQMQAKVRDGGKLGDWLHRHRLDALAPMWKRIRVAPGWESAVEAVLRERLAALDLGDGAGVDELLDDPAPATVSLLFGARRGPAQPVAPPEGTRALRELVHGEDCAADSLLDHWLGGVGGVERLAGEHWRDRDLGTAERIVARDGQMLDMAGLTQYAPDARTHGVMEREREIASCEADFAQGSERLDAAQRELDAAEADVLSLQERTAELRRELQGEQQRLHAQQVGLLKLVQARQRAEENAARVAHDLDELGQAEARETEHLEAAEAESGRAGALAELLRERLDSALDVLREREEELRTARAQEQGSAREVQELTFAERECTGKLADNERNLALARQQSERIAQEQGTRRAELDGLDEEVSAAALQQALAIRESREAALAATRERLAAATSALKENESLRMRTEQAVAPLRERIAELRLGVQAAELSVTQFEERLRESAADESSLRPLLGGELSESGLLREVARLAREIGELGAVNLAAIDELRAAEERKGYLDAQDADLGEAIETLEDAIRRIDRETREQLQSTYDFVNRHFGELFPQLFGGGQAKLVLTGEEILDAGIQIVAQPPGKKNSSIHLLSGGEKALTAIALVFSMFQLNPAPFCMLDEVDAPLDDTNTGRYGAMVRRMSAQTQFVFITHSKLTMEIAKQLVGVTMQEQGVSRVVEVDIEEALRMADVAVA